MPPASNYWTAFPGLRSIIRNGASQTGTQWTETALRAVYVILIGRILGPADYGLWSYVMAVYMFGVTTTILGMDFLLASRIGKDRGRAHALIETTLALRIVLLVVVCLVVALLASFTSSDAALQIGLLLVVPAIMGRGLTMWCRSIFTGFETSVTSLRITLLFRSLEILCGILLLFLTRNIMWLIALHAASWLVEAGFGLWAARRWTGAIKPHFHKEELNAIWQVASQVGVTALCVAGLTAAPIILARQLGASLETVGQLGIALQIASIAVMAAQGFLNASIPVLTRSVERSDSRSATYGLGVALVSIVLFGILFLLAHFLGPVLINLLVGESFAQAGRLLTFMVVIAGLSVLPNGFWQVAVIEGRHRLGLIAGVSAIVLMAGASPFAWEYAGIEGLLGAVAAGWLLRAIIVIFGRNIGKRTALAADQKST